MTSYANYIKHVRGKYGFSQEFVAEKLGISRPTFVLIEQNERDLTLTEAEKLAELFGLSMEEFLSRVERIEPTVIIKKGNKRSESALKVTVPANKLKKFKEVLLYILEKVGAKPNVGETALYKLLYFIDFDFFEKYGEKLTGATYMKNHYGPTPVEFKKIVSHMEAQGELALVSSKYFQYEQRKYLPRRAADLSLLNGLEKDHIDEVLVRLSDKTAKELSDYSHGDLPWQVTSDQEVIDYNFVFQRALPYAQRNHEEEWLNAAAEDVFLQLPPLSKKDYDYYMALPEKK